MRRALYSVWIAWSVLISAGAAGASGAPSLEVLEDLVTAYPRARVRGVLSPGVRHPAVAGGVRQDGLHAHPGGEKTPGRIEYALPLPKAKPGERLLLAFQFGLSDGIPWDRLTQPVDGVRFAVEVEGRRLFAQDWRESRWQAQAVDLTPWSGRRIRLALVTEAIGTVAYDWALWSELRLLRLPASARLASSRAAAKVGALVLAYRPGAGLRVRVRPVGAGEVREWQEPPGAPAAEGVRWLALDYSAPESRGVTVDVEPRSALAGAIWAAAYPPAPVLARVACTRAVPVAGARVRLRVEVRNAGRGLLEAGSARVSLNVGGRALPFRSVSAVAPGKVWRGEWEWIAPRRPGRYSLAARLLPDGVAATAKAIGFETYPAPSPERTRTLQNERVRLEFVRSGAGFAYARVLAREGSRWTPLGVMRPLMRVTADAGGKSWDWSARPPRVVTSRHALTFEESRRDPDGATWTARLRVSLEPGAKMARLDYDWRADRSRRVRALWGPNLYVGDGTTGAAKLWGLFPGLEYLYKGEPSSNPRDFAPPLHDRRTPHPWKITAPFMAVTVGPGGQAPPARMARFYCPDSLKDLPPAGHAPGTDRGGVTAALLWDLPPKAGGAPVLSSKTNFLVQMPSVRYVSPNDDEGMANHRMGLFLPSVPDYVPENADRATRPFLLPAGRTIRLPARLLVAPGPAMQAFGDWVRHRGGLPAPNPWPRPFEEAMALCRVGFLRTVWNEKTEKWRACIEFAEDHVPGIAALLWMDARVTGSTEADARVEQAARAMLRDGGPRLFGSRSSMHIMRWEFPFLYGYLPEALAGAEEEIRALLVSQQPEGGWRFHASDAQHVDLGAQGDSVVGFNAHNAWMLARFARVTGDRAAREAAEKALRFMERFRVPRGAGTWECPLYEPDILAAAWVLPAYLEGWKATGNPRWLHDAVYWAETGVPFVYLWSLPGRPMMLGGSIPVFGSTFYMHSWLAMPVQWEGMVYAYHLRHLAEALEQARPRADGSPLTPVLGFGPGDWRRLAELQVVSGMYQQVAEGERIGTYPDSITGFEKRNPVFINPENIAVNLLAMRGFDPEIRTARLRRDGDAVTISSGARIEGMEFMTKGARFRLRFFPGQASHTLVAGLRPGAIRVNGQTLPRLETPVRREPGWWWDAERERLYLTVEHATETVDVEVMTP